jgi:hypothetical protein
MDSSTETPQPEARRGRRRSGLIALLLALSLGTIGAGVFSLAIFTDTDTATGAFTTGTVDIATTPTALFTVSGMLPGDSGSATLTVANNGTGQLRYAMTSVSTNADAKALRDQLQLSIKAGACPGGGTALYTGALNGAAFGDPTQGAQAGDRNLASGASEPLCFAWSLALATGNAYQNAATTATFTFAAEQTANNP